MSLILHCGSNAVNEEALREIPTPEATTSWYPLGYGTILDIIQNALEDSDFNVVDQGFGLNKNNNQMFGALALNNGDEETDLTIGIRQSLDKSLALGIAVGARVMVCDNLCFSGDLLRVIRRNTRHIERDFTLVVDDMIANMVDHYDTLCETHETWKGIPVTLDRGYEILGLGLGQERLTSHVVSKALKEWREPSYDAFTRIDEQGSLWGLYNALTEGAKSVRPGALIDTHTKIRGFIDSVANEV